LRLAGDVDAALAETGRRQSGLGHGAQRLARAERSARREYLDARLPKTVGQIRVEGQHPLGDGFPADGREVIDRRAEGEDGGEWRAAGFCPAGRSDGLVAPVVEGEGV